ncbi:PDZ domain-containing protein [Halobacillus sp. B23F22_1]|uniref:PDZ domain-containing protein n=1 Tax=Halobacillus sp. B23F22_1 TaxID=3459514 RepID=UPI00373EF1CD
MDIWLQEAIQGLVRLGIQPLLYWSLLLLFVISIRRMKQERKRFGTRVYDIFTEGRSTWKVSLAAGFFLTVFAIGIGVVLPYYYLLLVAVITIVLSLPFHLKLLSPVYTVGLSVLLLWLLPFLPAGVLPAEMVSVLTSVSLSATAILMSLLLLVEGIFLTQTSSRRTFPERIVSQRGKKIGQHRVKKLAVIPMVSLFPAGMIEPFAPWWPMFSVGDGSYGFVLFPLLLGYEWVARAQSPKLAAITLGKQTNGLAMLSLLFAAASIFLPVLAIAAVIIAVIGRLFIYTFHKSREKSKPYFTQDQRGVRILGTIPGSPADEMDLLPGELIVRVNGIPVASVHEFYEALQTNRTLTKVEVRDFRGENRYEQRAMYEGDHHELGLLFVQEVSYESMAQ